ncbi:hypothetical protein ABCW43_00295 [Neorhizobium sp. IRAMC:178]|uniref:hypothetical protein n=1 Tax=Neorhizobium tunisiense TaxID=3144793 RepID=UPI0031F6699B
MKMAATATYQCKECKKPFEARAADRARGWAKFCSKSCKAIKQTKAKTRRSNYPRHDGVSPMKHKFCEDCGAPAVNGVHGMDGRITWHCARHMFDAQEHPFSSDALGQW